MEDKKITTNIISLYGGPGVGKSTSAAYMYYLLKTYGENAELVREYVKGWAWEGRVFSAYDQIYFLGKQARQESVLFGKAKWLVTDSPVFMNLYYASLYCSPSLANGVKEAATSFYKQAMEDGHKHYHIMLHRAHPYANDGRYQNEEEALAIDIGIEKMLEDLKIQNIIHCKPDEGSLKYLLQTFVVPPGLTSLP